LATEFHENLLRYNPEAVLLILNGPISSEAPYATEEQPGPAYLQVKGKEIKTMT
jgi:hypothetical protein